MQSVRHITLERGTHSQSAVVIFFGNTFTSVKEEKVALFKHFCRHEAKSFLFTYVHFLKSLGIFVEVSFLKIFWKRTLLTYQMKNNGVLKLWRNTVCIDMKQMICQQSKQRATRNAYECKTFIWESRICFPASFPIYLVRFNSELLHDIILLQKFQLIQFIIVFYCFIIIIYHLQLLLFLRKRPQ